MWLSMGLNCWYLLLLLILVCMWLSMGLLLIFTLIAVVADFSLHVAFHGTVAYRHVAKLLHWAALKCCWYLLWLLLLLILVCMWLSMGLLLIKCKSSWPYKHFGVSLDGIMQVPCRQFSTCLVKCCHVSNKCSRGHIIPQYHVFACLFIKRPSQLIGFIT